MNAKTRGAIQEVVMELVLGEINSNQAIHCIEKLITDEVAAALKLPRPPPES